MIIIKDIVLCSLLGLYASLGENKIQTFVTVQALSTELLATFISLSSTTVSTLLAKHKCALLLLEEVNYASVKRTVEPTLTSFD
jgi:hypothetical protein